MFPSGPGFGGWWIAVATVLCLTVLALLRVWNWRVAGAPVGGRCNARGFLTTDLRFIALCVLLAGLLIASQGCGGSSGGGTPSPSPESGTVTVTGTSSSISHTTTISVSVS
jgi:hypothetical protein